MVVVPTCAPEWISRCLDSGAQAIIVPHVNTVAQAEMCVNASKFPPLVYGSHQPVGTFIPDISDLYHRDTVR
jgi:2-keto-3-deoxy-L-rhamnonate aldolase RhmA